ncbi:hypothetical protein LTR50_005162 [Elasticomyces elasticus]|nr:hypothetical protein LTR50_005162 [Elasticomyces elasticus]
MSLAEKEEHGMKHEHELKFAGGGFSTTWNKDYAILNCQLEDPTSEFAQEMPIIDPRAADWVARFLEEHVGDLASSQGQNGKITVQVEQQKWLHMMMWMLHYSVRNVSLFLTATHVKPFPPASWIADTLQFLASSYKNAEPDSKLLMHDFLVDIFCTLMDRGDEASLRLDGSSIRLLLYDCNEEQTTRLYESIRTHGTLVHWNTYLHFATRFAQHGHILRAVECILHAKTAAADLTAPQVQQTCAFILRQSAKQPDGFRISAHIMSSLAEMGLQPAVYHYNIMILNAIEAGDMTTAFSIYQSMRDRGARPDEYTYTILLKACKSSIQDSETLHHIIRETVRGVEVLKSSWVATQILHCLFLFHFKQKDSAGAFETLSKAYREMFDPLPLYKLGILQPTQTDEDPAPVLRPSAPALSIIIAAYLVHLSYRVEHHGTSAKRELYRRFRAAISEHDHTLVSLMQTTYTHNAFLLAFARSNNTLEDAAQVLHDMRTPIVLAPPHSLPSPDDIDSPPESESITPCPPDSISYSILLDGLSKHNKMHLATQLLQKMEEQGLKPSVVTFNTQIRAHAAAQNVEQAVKAVRRMEDAGFERGEDVMRSLRRMTDQEALVKGLRDSALRDDDVHERASVQVDQNRERSPEDDDGNEFVGSPAWASG